MSERVKELTDKNYSDFIESTEKYKDYR